MPPSRPRRSCAESVVVPYEQRYLFKGRPRHVAGDDESGTCLSAGRDLEGAAEPSGGAVTGVDVDRAGLHHEAAPVVVEADVLPAELERHGPGLPRRERHALEPAQ